MNLEFNLATLHFLRPEWFYAFIPLVLLAILLLRRKLFSRNWSSIIDPKLMPHVLIGKPGKQSYVPVALLLIVGSLAILAEAGPVWQRLPQPVFKQQSALVIALDLSSSMNAEDVKPSRLQRAQFKLRDLLALRKEGQTALIVYANAAFTVTPLTDDTNTIISMVPSLSTDMLPAQGNNTEVAILKSIELMKNAGVLNGDILLISDDINSSMEIFSRAHQQGYSVSVLGIGTEDGAPIATSKGDFIKDDQGGIVISKMDTAKFIAAARQGGGRYSALTTDDSDIQYLLGASDINKLKSNNKLTDLKTDTWHEQGPWLLLLVIPLAALAFRKGYIVVLMFFILPLPQPAQAISWDALWKNDNQRAAEELANNSPQAAADLFTNPQWQAAANYRAGRHEQAAQALQGIDTSDAHYNRGNALAKAGNLDAAISAYDEALRLNPNNEDARYNKELVQQQKKDPSSGKPSDKNENSDKKDPSEKSQQNSAGQKQSDQSQAENNKSDNNRSDKDKPDQNNAGQKKSDTSEKSKPQDAASTPDNKPASPQSSAQQNKQPPPGEQATTPPDANSSQQPGLTESKPDLTKQATEQWLRKIPDDPGGLLRRKFQHQYQQQSKNSQGHDSW